MDQPVALHAQLEQWLTGLPGTRAARRTVVVEDAGVVPRLVRSGVVDGATLLLTRAPAAGLDPAAAPAPGATVRYTGSFTAEDDVVRCSDGLLVRTRQYALAEFVGLDAPTALRLRDAEDLSAFLRDADVAWESGVFADHAGHPLSMITDLAAVGGDADAAGPLRRVHVDAGGTVSTSPTGAPLGEADDGVAALQDRWLALNAASSRPDAVGLARAVGERDRVEALRERPWIGRYVEALAAIRAVRTSHRVPERVGGFGPRLTAGLPRPAEADPCGAPVLLAVGEGVLARDAAGPGEVALAGAEVAALERALAGDHDDGALSGALDALGRRGIAVAWCERTARAAAGETVP